MLRATATGDREAFTQLVGSTRDGVWRLIRNLTSDPAAAEDVLQETYVAVWRSASTYRGEGSARAWIHGLARRLSARSWRRRAGEPSTLVPLQELGAQAGWGRDPEELTAALEDRQLLASALEQLAPHDRQILVLCDLEGLSGPEAGALLDLTPSAARVRLHRARLRLMAQLRGGSDG